MTIIFRWDTFDVYSAAVVAIYVLTRFLPSEEYTIYKVLWRASSYQTDLSTLMARKRGLITRQSINTVFLDLRSCPCRRLTAARGVEPGMFFSGYVSEHVV